MNSLALSQWFKKALSRMRDVDAIFRIPMALWIIYLQFVILEILLSCIFFYILVFPLDVIKFANVPPCLPLLRVSRGGS